LQSNAARTLDGFENFVCESERNGEPVILRIGHSSHRSPDEAQAELDWIRYLWDNGVSVCRPIASVDEKLVETVSRSADLFVAAAFEKAAGRSLPKDKMTLETFRNRGRQLGQIHALSRNYRPPADKPQRKQWYEEADFARCETFLPRSDEVIAQRMKELIDRLRSTPTNGDNYGLIHFDAHQGNLLFDGERPVLFDFDDCAYDFYVSDLVIPLFYMITFPPSGWSAVDYARHFFGPFLQGYREESFLDDQLLSLAPMILKRRETVLYVAIHRGMDMNNLDPWCARFMQGRRESIERDRPYLDIDFSEFADRGAKA